MLTLDLKAVKQGILDQQRITDAAEKASVKALAKFGAFVRTRARTSIRKRKKVSDAGKLPSSHTGLIRDHILFLVEARERNVIIGPMKLNGTKSPTALRALEHGGPTLIMDHGKPRSVTIAARPFMQPAFAIELEKAPKLWENTLK